MGYDGFRCGMRLFTVQTLCRHIQVVSDEKYVFVVWLACCWDSRRASYPDEFKWTQQQQQQHRTTNNHTS